MREINTKYILSVFIAVVSISVITACSGDDNQQASTSSPEPQKRLTTEETQDLRGVTMTEWSTPPEIMIDLEKTYSALIKTNKGEIDVELFSKEVPITVNNFVFLSREGFYNNVKFHRIISGFMIQTGDPTGTGRGGPGYRFNDEPVTRNYLKGTLAMANSGPNTNGSQFFIMHNENPLPKNYTIFGIATDGFDTIDAIASSTVTNSPTGESSLPLEEIIIEGIIITEN